MTKNTIKINMEKVDYNYQEIKNHPALFEIENNLIEAMLCDSNYAIYDLLIDEIEKQTDSFGYKFCEDCFDKLEFSKLLLDVIKSYGTYLSREITIEDYYYKTICNRLDIIFKSAIYKIVNAITIEIESDNLFIPIIVKSHLSTFCNQLASSVIVSDEHQIDDLRIGFYINFNQEIERISKFYNFKYRTTYI